MRLAKVIGNVVSTIKNEKLKGIKLLIIRPVTPEGEMFGRDVIVADYLNTAIGSTVYWIEDGITICKWKGIKSIPLRGSVIGHVDKIDRKKDQ